MKFPKVNLKFPAVPRPNLKLSRKGLFVVGSFLLISIVSGGAYASYRYISADKAIKECDRKFSDKDYMGAAVSCEKSLSYWYRQYAKEIAEKARRIAGSYGFYLQGLEKFASGDWQGAIDLLSNVSAEDPNYADAVEKIGKAKSEIEAQVATEVATEPSPQPPPTSTCPTLSNKYASVLEISDGLGHKYKQSEANKCEGSYQLQLWKVRRGQTVTIEVSVNNPTAPPVIYEFIGEGFPNIEQTSNKVTVTFDNSFSVNPGHLRVFIKNSDQWYRAPYYDDMIQVFLSISD